MRFAKRWMGRSAFLAAAVCCVLIVTPVEAQSTKTAKEAQSLEKAGENSQKAVQDLLDHMKKLLVGYNSIIDGEAKNPQSAYKKLVGDLKDTEKKRDGTKKQVVALNKEADKFFKAWEQDLDSISSDSLREKSAKRLELARTRYASLGETLAQARDEFAPLVQNLNDQILFLGRDLSPAAVADLKDEAEALNQQAAEVSAKVKELLQSAGKTQDEADAELEAEENE